MTFDEFIVAYDKLKNSLPRSPTFTLDSDDCDFTSYVYHSNNCYFCFDCGGSKNLLYCFDSWKNTDCIDCDFCVECELLYESVDCFKAYNSAYLDYCARIYDSYFCWDCMDCHDLFGCVHLKQKQYCIFNKQYSKEDYGIKVEELLKENPAENLATLRKLSNKYPFGSTNVTHSENSDYGNHVHYSTNCYLCFDGSHNENCGYLYDSARCKNSYDLTQCGDAELCYECSDSGKIYNSDFLEWSGDCYDCSYLMSCNDCHNCFGCVAISHKRFCLLNKQYKEDEYYRLVGNIKSTVH